MPTHTRSIELHKLEPLLHSPAAPAPIRPPSLPSPLLPTPSLFSSCLLSSYSSLFILSAWPWRIGMCLLLLSITNRSAGACKRKGGDEIVAMMLARLTQRPRGGVMPARSLVLLIEPCQYLSTLSYEIRSHSLQSGFPLSCSLWDLV